MMNQLGIAVLVFLTVFAGVMLASKMQTTWLLILLAILGYCGLFMLMQTGEIVLSAGCIVFIVVLTVFIVFSGSLIQKIIGGLVGLPALCVLIMNVGHLLGIFGGVGSGSPAFAEKWTRRFEDFPTPKAAQSRHFLAVESHEFPDGSWLYAVCSRSHNNANGGTVVIRDSSGAIRAFFGHVCIGDLDWILGLSTNHPPQNAQDIYKGMERWGFEEYDPLAEDRGANNIIDDIALPASHHA